MWYVIIGGIVLWVTYLFYKKRQLRAAQNTSIRVVQNSLHVNNTGWEEVKEDKEKSLKLLKTSFKPASDNKTALTDTFSILATFHKNHGQSMEELESLVSSLNLPNDEMKLEAALRKEINRFYKQRDDLKSKAMAIHLSYLHVQLQLQNPEYEWKSFFGLQKLQSNWKAVEYFHGLLLLMTAFKSTFPNSPNTEKLTANIGRMFELWNSQNIARENYETQLKAYEAAQSASDKHFVILSIIEYLERSYKFNPSCKAVLIDWCLKDIDLYEDFLKSFHEHQLFTIKELVAFQNNPNLKEKKLKGISFDRVKKLKSYVVPRLNSYDVLKSMYEADGKVRELQWLRSVGARIGYGDENSSGETEEIDTFDQKVITRQIEVPKSGQKGKLGFLNSSGELCSTESVFQDYSEKQGWRVMRAEVSFWQAMFCLTFWDEIYQGMATPSGGQDIPSDLFTGEDFYINRRQAIDSRCEQIRSVNLVDFINRQLKKTEGTWTRLIHGGTQDMSVYAKSEIVQDFIERIDPEIYAKVVFRIAQNPSENRSGVPDFVIWNEDELRMVEVKKMREQVREAQLGWLSWMVEENIPVEIVRVKGI